MTSQGQQALSAAAAAYPQALATTMITCGVITGVGLVALRLLSGRARRTG